MKKFFLVILALFLTGSVLSAPIYWGSKTIVKSGLIDENGNFVTGNGYVKVTGVVDLAANSINAWISDGAGNTVTSNKGKLNTQAWLLDGSGNSITSNNGNLNSIAKVHDANGNAIGSEQVHAGGRGLYTTSTLYSTTGEAIRTFGGAGGYSVGIGLADPNYPFSQMGNETNPVMISGTVRITDDSFNTIGISGSPISVTCPAMYESGGVNYIKTSIGGYPTKGIAIQGGTGSYVGMSVTSAVYPDYYTGISITSAVYPDYYTGISVTSAVYPDYYTAVTSIAGDLANIINGLVYNISDYNADIDTAKPYYVSIYTGNTAVRTALKITCNYDGAGVSRLYEDSVIGIAGTTITAYNNDRTSVNIATIIAYSGSNTTTAGTNIGTRQVGLGAIGSIGGSGEYNTWLLKPDTVYTYSFTPDAENAKGTVTLSFRELSY